MHTMTTTMMRINKTTPQTTPITIHFQVSEGGVEVGVGVGVGFGVVVSAKSRCISPRSLLPIAT